MKFLISAVLLCLFYASNVLATMDEPPQYKKNACLETILEILGPEYKLNSHDIITRLEKNNTITVLHANGSSVQVQPNGGCIREKDKLNDYTGVLLGAYEKVREAEDKAKKTGKSLQSPYMEAIASCKAQESESHWYKISTELGPKLQKGAPAKTTR